jgi:DnaJ-class molecular chaperone
MKRVGEQTYYEILEVAPDASVVEIQQAYEHARETFQKDSVAVYSLFSEKEMEQIQAAVEEAYRVLIDETSRKNYDQTHLSALSLKWPKSEKLPEPPESPMGKKTYLPFSEISIDLGEGPYRGKMLKQIRERMGVDLKTVSVETKISLKILQWIEEENAEQLPALVYLKGFLKGYAQCLGLDPRRVIEDYLNSLGPSKKK